jgi:nucleoid-associated protein YgaU
LAALGVVVFGLVAALPFREPATGQPEMKPVVAPVPLPLRRPDVPLALATAGEHSPASGLSQASPPASEVRTIPPASETMADRLNVAPPPAMPIAFHPITDELKPTSWKPTPPVVERPSTNPRKYVLRDGDSLERLAERFLGDKSRAEEIFAMNRHVLSRVDLLPVGAEIVLPPRLMKDH